jgi:predicted negative regulator of RcsB-dependent stress response
MSQRHPGARRASRESKSGDADDAFVAGILDFSNWARQNQQALTVAVVVIAILVAGGLYYNSYRGQLVNQAAEQLETIHQSIALDDVEGAKIDLATFLDRFAGTAYEGEARLMLGELYLRTGDPQQALAVLEPLGASPRSPIEFQGASLLAKAYEQEERLADAEETYLTIAGRSELEFQVRDALAAAARIRETQGDGPGAIQLYERILDEVEVTAPERGMYEMRIQELRSATNI